MYKKNLKLIKYKSQRSAKLFYVKICPNIKKLKVAHFFTEWLNCLSGSCKECLNAKYSVTIDYTKLMLDGFIFSSCLHIVLKITHPLIGIVHDNSFLLSHFSCNTKEYF